MSPADAVFDGALKVNGDAVVAIKGVPWPITELLDDANSGTTSYGELFKNGWFCHSFLGPHDYHRQHAPVSGTVLEARVIEGLCYLQVDVEEDKNGRRTIAPRRHLFGPRLAALPGDAGLNAPDEPGYQFIQARALVLIETPDIGLVAVLPIGMAQVSSVVLSVKAGEEVKKGDELSYFQFGGSDIVMVFQERADVQFTAQDQVHYNFGQEVAVSGSGKVCTVLFTVGEARNCADTLLVLGSHRFP